MNLKFKITLILFAIAFLYCCNIKTSASGILTGADQPELYLMKLQGKRVGLMVNQTSLVHQTHLVDFLLAEKIDVQKIFAVEHGFRGEAADGEMIGNSIDAKTGIKIVSLYGEKKKATDEDLSGIDLLVFDIQDVGCRFYTYTSSMLYMMEACAKNHIPLMVLDRPNPNGDYVDGPVLDMNFKSFVGLMPIPVVHGCTVGELALMINGEGWLEKGLKCELEIVKVKNYTHQTVYHLPVKTSPNLPNQLSVRLYPSLCFFEATNVSIGRGTAFPFQVIGFPGCAISEFTFTPKTIAGVSNQPIHEEKECNGIDFRNMESIPTFTLSYFIQFFRQFGKSDDFWKSKRWIELLSGNGQFYDQINNGLTEQEIRATWQPQLSNYLKIRKQYLLYPDFD